MHGAGGADAAEWELQIPSLCAAGYRVFYPLRADHEPSDPHSARYKGACDVLALLDASQVNRAVLVGHSAGGSVAMQFYLSWPERVRAIVSVDSAAFGKLSCKGLAQQGYDEKTRALYEKNKDILNKLGRAWDYPSDENVQRLANRAALRKTQRDSVAKATPKATPNTRSVPEGKFCKVPLLVFTTGRGHIRPDEAPSSCCVSESPRRTQLWWRWLIAATGYIATCRRVQRRTAGISAQSARGLPMQLRLVTTIATHSPHPP